MVDSVALTHGVDASRRRYSRIPAPNSASRQPVPAARPRGKPAQGPGPAPRPGSLQSMWAAAGPSPARAASGRHAVRPPVFCPLRLRQCRSGHCRVLYQRGHLVGAGYGYPRLLGRRDLAQSHVGGGSCSTAKRPLCRFLSGGPSGRGTIRAG